MSKFLIELEFTTTKPALLKTKKPFVVTKLEDVAGCLKSDGEPATLEDMEDAIRQGVEEIFTNSSSNVAD
ncbi:hypothetical protein WJM97_03510 [Okeanomitos corallinicola TIOX110]|uniref:Uncharacterized protein n=1 Tax=Okeanomitos corallinicola TIOX110 TaxID=3133117 RepID=A0ABZ2UV48_9CYAN